MRKSQRRNDAHFFKNIREQLSRNGPEDLARKAVKLFEAVDKNPAQKAFVLDPARRKTLCTPRRAGKTYALGTCLLGPALLRPRSNILYLTLTRETGRKILWSWLKERNDELEFSLTKEDFHNTYLELRLPNGSKLTLAGASTKDEIDKHRGQAYDVVAIDEAQAFPHLILDELIDEVISPALLDRRGTLILAGTPGPILAGSFYRASNRYREDVRPYVERDEPKWEGQPWLWSYHTWSLQDNVALNKPGELGAWDEALEEKKRKGWTDQTPKWRREYLGEWVSDKSQFVYLYDKEGDGKNDFEPDPKTPRGLPEGHKWTFVLGIDIGYTADTSFQVAAFSATYPDLFFVEEINKPKLLVDDIAAEILQLEEAYGDFEAIVADKGNLATTLVESIQQRFSIPLVAAEKREKRDHIELFNADLVAGRVKVSSRCPVLKHQMRTVQWDKTLEKEDKRFANHATDAAVYVWRYCRHHFWQEGMVEPERGTPAWERLMVKTKIREATERRKRARGEEWWEGHAANMDEPLHYSALDSLFPDGGDL